MAQGVKKVRMDEHEKGYCGGDRHGGAGDRCGDVRCGEADAWKILDKCGCLLSLKFLNLWPTLNQDQTDNDKQLLCFKHLFPHASKTEEYL